MMRPVDDSRPAIIMTNRTLNLFTNAPADIPVEKYIKFGYIQNNVNLLLQHILQYLGCERFVDIKKLYFKHIVITVKILGLGHLQ